MLHLATATDVAGEQRPTNNHLQAAKLHNHPKKESTAARSWNGDAPKEMGESLKHSGVLKKYIFNFKLNIPAKSRSFIIMHEFFHAF